MQQSLVDMDWGSPGVTSGYSLMPQMKAPDGMVWDDALGQWIPEGHEQQNNMKDFLKYLMSGSGGTGSLAGNLGTMAGRAVGYGLGNRAPTGAGAAGSGGGGLLSLFGIA